MMPYDRKFQKSAAELTRMKPRGEANGDVDSLTTRPCPIFDRAGIDSLLVGYSGPKSILGLDSAKSRHTSSTSFTPPRIEARVVSAPFCGRFIALPDLPDFSRAAMQNAARLNPGGGAPR